MELLTLLSDKQNKYIQKIKSVFHNFINGCDEIKDSNLNEAEKELYNTMLLYAQENLNFNDASIYYKFYRNKEGLKNVAIIKELLIDIQNKLKQGAVIKLARRYLEFNYALHFHFVEMRDGLIKELVDLNISNLNQTREQGGMVNPQLYKFGDCDFYMIEISMPLEFVNKLVEAMIRHYKKYRVDCVIKVVDDMNELPDLEPVSEFTIELRGLQMDDIRSEYIKLKETK